jgi:hypothetical protein
MLKLSRKKIRIQSMKIVSVYFYLRLPGLLVNRSVPQQYRRQIALM